MATALDTYLPFDSGPGANVTEDQWREMARFFVGTGPIRGEDNEMLVYGDSTGLQVKVKTGKGYMRGHFGTLTAERTLPVSSPAGLAGGQSRTDIVVLRGDFVNNRLEVDVVTGSAGAPGVAPAVTQSSAIWEVALASVGPLTNATATIAAGTVTDLRTLITPPSAISGAYTAYTPTLTQSGAVTKTVTEARYIQIGKIIIGYVTLTATGAGTGGQPVRVGLPVAARSTVASVGAGYIYDASANLTFAGVATLATATTVVLFLSEAAGINQPLGQDGFTVGLASGDGITVHFCYEAA